MGIFLIEDLSINLTELTVNLCKQVLLPSYLQLTAVICGRNIIVGEVYTF